MFDKAEKKFLKSLGQNINQIRKDKGLSFQELSFERVTLFSFIFDLFFRP